MSEAPAVDYALQIIDILASSNSKLGISEISRRSGINKNAVSRVLGALTEFNWAVRERDEYSLTLTPFRITSQALMRTSVYNISFPVLRKLWENTGDSCYLGIIKDNKVLYIQHLASVHDISVAGRVGGMYSMHCSAAGKVLLAYSSAEYQNEYCNTMLEPKTLHTITNKDELLRQLDEIKKTGVACDNEEGSYGILCVAAPVYDYNGAVIAAVGISTSTIYRNIDTLLADQGKKVCAAAEEISGILGHI